MSFKKTAIIRYKYKQDRDNAIPVFFVAPAIQFCGIKIPTGHEYRFELDPGFLPPVLVIRACYDGIKECDYSFDSDVTSLIQARVNQELLRSHSERAENASLLFAAKYGEDVRQSIEAIIPRHFIPA